MFPKGCGICSTVNIVRLHGWKRYMVTKADAQGLILDVNLLKFTGVEV